MRPALFPTRLADSAWDIPYEELYARGIAAGALGGKLLGAGGGGFLVFYVQPDRQNSVRWAMRDLMHIPFEFEDGGTRVIHYTPEVYEPKMN